jgi:CrcB protein
MTGSESDEHLEQHSMKNALLVFLGGGIGSVLRYLTVVGLAKVGVSGSFPWSIFAANLLGSFILGFLFGLPSMQTRDTGPWFFCATGVLGGYTTFSTLSNDSWVLFMNGRVLAAFANAFGSAALGIVCAALGYTTAKAIAS